MGGRFGKYGDLKRKAALWRSRKEKGRLQKVNAFKPSQKRKKMKTVTEEMQKLAHFQSCPSGRISLINTTSLTSCACGSDTQRLATEGPNFRYQA